MLDNFMQFINGWGQNVQPNQQPQIPGGMPGGAPGAGGMPQPQPQMPTQIPGGQYGPNQQMGGMGMNPMQGAQDNGIRQQMIMKMLQQGMGGQGQGPQQGQLPPMTMAPGRPAMPGMGGGSATQALMQQMHPGMMMRRPIGM